MIFNRDFLTSGPGQAILVALVLILGIFAVRWQRKPQPPVTKATTSKPAPSVPLPKVLTREGTKFLKPTPPPASAVASQPSPASTTKPNLPIPRELPLALFEGAKPLPVETPVPSAPFGRLIPCETVVTLESSQLDTPLVGLVTEDVWHNGQLIVPAGAEVHGPTSLDRIRERIAAHGHWRIVWRTRDPSNGRELAVQGIALDRKLDHDRGTWSELDGSAGLRGQVVKSTDERELKLFASTFLSTATAALQTFQPAAGLLGSAALPAATARNAALAGTSAVLREYAQELKDSIARDGFYLRVRTGTPFYLYVTETLNPTRPRLAASSSQP